MDRKYKYTSSQQWCFLTSSYLCQSLPSFLFSVLFRLIACILYRKFLFEILKMVYFSKLATAVAAVCLASSVLAHPGEHHDHAAVKREVVARNQMASAAKRSIDSCSNSLKHRELNARSIARREETLHSIRKARGIKSSKCPPLDLLKQKRSLRPDRAPKVPSRPRNPRDLRSS